MTILVTYRVSSKGYWEHSRITWRNPSLLVIVSTLYNNQAVGNIVGLPPEHVQSLILYFSCNYTEQLHSVNNSAIETNTLSLPWIKRPTYVRGFAVCVTETQSRCFCPSLSHLKFVHDKV